MQLALLVLALLRKNIKLGISIGLQSSYCYFITLSQNFYDRKIIFFINIKYYIIYDIKFLASRFSHYQQNLHAQISIKLLLLLIGHRTLRKLNSTGDKYAHLPDIAGFLIKQESKVGMTIVLIIGN